MPTYVALLRGVNVGGRVIKMADLKTCCESLGLTSVRTVLQSGNVVFATGRPAAELKSLVEAGLTKTFGYPAKAQVYDIETIRRIVTDSPFRQDPEHHSYVIFCENGVELQIAANHPDLDSAVEEISLGDGVVYWRVVKGMTLKSRLGKGLGSTKLAPFLTNRNIQTLQKILAQ